VDVDGQRYQPITIHRALFGSIERFFGILIEHFAGNFPLWLAPVQVILLPIADRHMEYANSIKNQLMTYGYRVEVDQRNEKVGFKIREAEVSKIPYMLVIGDKEMDDKKISVRHKGEGDLGQMSLENLIEKIREELYS
jgi:threonyl-tRNA synthetase